MAPRKPLDVPDVACIIAAFAVGSPAVRRACSSTTRELRRVNTACAAAVADVGLHRYVAPLLRDVEPSPATTALSPECRAARFPFEVHQDNGATMILSVTDQLPAGVSGASEADLATLDIDQSAAIAALSAADATSSSLLQPALLPAAGRLRRFVEATRSRRVRFLAPTANPSIAAAWCVALGPNAIAAIDADLATFVAMVPLLQRRSILWPAASQAASRVAVTLRLDVLRNVRSKDVENATADLQRAASLVAEWSRLMGAAACACSVDVPRAPAGVLRVVVDIMAALAGGGDALRCVRFQLGDVREIEADGIDGAIAAIARASPSLEHLAVVGNPFTHVLRPKTGRRGLASLGELNPLTLRSLWLVGSAGVLPEDVTAFAKRAEESAAEAGRQPALTSLSLHRCAGNTAEWSSGASGIPDAIRCFSALRHLDVGGTSLLQCGDLLGAVSAGCPDLRSLECAGVALLAFERIDTVKRLRAPLLEHLDVSPLPVGIANQMLDPISQDGAASRLASLVVTHLGGVCLPRSVRHVRLGSCTAVIHRSDFTLQKSASGTLSQLTSLDITADEVDLRALDCIGEECVKLRVLELNVLDSFSSLAGSADEVAAALLGTAEAPRLARIQLIDLVGCGLADPGASDPIRVVVAALRAAAEASARKVKILFEEE